MTNKTNCTIMYDPTTLMGLSDHVFVKTLITTPYLTRRKAAPLRTQEKTVMYKWIEGTNIASYNNSA
jgi:hypothetical protein